MASASSVSRLVVIIILINVGAMSDTTIVVIASAAAGLLSSPILLEREALLFTGWWYNNWATSGNYTSNHCKWTGVSCNSAGSVIGVSLLWYENDNIRGELGRFKFFCFPNLRSFKIHSNYSISGSIPSEITALSMLQTLELPSNGLTGKLRNFNIYIYVCIKSGWCLKQASVFTTLKKLLGNWWVEQTRS